ncbi:MAG: hypothetical protein ABI792_08985 [bacterium]
MQKKVLFAFDDPGGGLAVITLAERLKEEENLNMKIYAGKLNEKILKDKKIEFNIIDSKIDKGTAEKIINEFEPDILISGTSGGNAEQELRNVSSEKNIKSIVILDFWKDYSRRWLYASYPVDNLYDTVCVMDDATKKEMVEEHFTGDRLLVTGNPYLDKIFNYRQNAACDYSIDNFCVNNFLFLSQPLHIIGITDYKIHPLEVFLQSLKQISEIKQVKVKLKIKLHPLEEEPGEIMKLVIKYNTDNLSVKLSDKGESLNDLINESEAVIGFNTIAMFEARAMRKRTISLNVVAVKNSLTEAMNTAGIEIVKSDKKEITKCLIKDCKDNKEENIFQGGIENCTAVIFKELNLN